MIRTLAAIFMGQITIIFLNGIVRMAVGVYLDIEFSLAGISYLPGVLWEVLIVGLSLSYGFIGGIIVSLIANGDGRVEVLGLTLIIASVSLFDYYYLGSSEPLWYYLINSALLISGLFLSYRYMKANENILEHKIDHSV